MIDTIRLRIVYFVAWCFRVPIRVRDEFWMPELATDYGGLVTASEASGGTSANCVVSDLGK